MQMQLRIPREAEINWGSGMVEADILRFTAWQLKAWSNWVHLRSCR